MPGFPLSSRENLICGVLDESKNSENGKITLIYLDPTADHTEQIEVEIDKESDLGNLKMKAEKYLQAKMNPLFSPYTEKYPPLYCFEKKGFSPLRLLNPSHGLSLRYVEFRRSINTKEINESIQNANDQYEYGHLVSYFILNKIDAEVESFDKAQEKVKYKEIFNRSQNFRQEMTKKIKALHLEKFVESHLLFRLNSGLDRILQYIMDTSNRAM